VAGSLRSPRAKIKRAKKHIQEFEAITSGLVFATRTHPHVIVTGSESETGKVVYKIAHVPDVPDEVSSVAGDAIHNLRSAFDRLMTQLVERNGKRPKNGWTPYFPIGSDRQNFEARCDSALEQWVGKDALRCIRASEAYRGGKGEAAWYLHHLDIEDKHRVEYALGFDLSSLTLALPRFPVFDVFTAEQTAAIQRMSAEMMNKIFWRPTDNLFPLKPGDVLQTGPPEPANDPKFRLDIAFAEPEIVQAQPVLPLLTQFLQATEALVETFASLF
jgi:hypothetical protein